MSDRDDLLLPSGARLVHIGPHKTGSTALQAAFHQAREQLQAAGVDYAGDRRHETAAAHWVIGRSTGFESPEQGRRRWQRLTEQMKRAGDRRVVLSSEYFAGADDAAIRRILGDVGGARAHVAVTLRPLAKILPSQWQQYVVRGLRVPYEPWLDAMFNRAPYRRPTPTFWKRHRHDELVRRWARVVGPDHLTVVVLDPADHEFLPRAFERMLGLPEQTLRMTEEGQNRSLTAVETDALLSFNRHYRAEDLPADVRVQMMRSTVTRYLKQRVPDPAEPRIQTPAWASERAALLGEEMAKAIADSGVHVVGNLSVLSAGAGDGPAAGAADGPAAGAADSAAAGGRQGREAGVSSWDVEVAGRLATGIATVVADQHATLAALRGGPKGSRAQTLSEDDVPARDLADLLAHRARRRAGRYVSAIARTVRRRR